VKYKVNFINSSYRRYYAEHREEILEAIDRCFTSGDFILREDVNKFEANLCKFTGAKYAVGVNSGTDALKLSYRALGCGPGNEVITVSHTFLASIEEIVHLGATPILIDAGEDALMDVSKIEGVITDKTVGIVPVHLSGKVCNMDEIMRIAKRYNLWVVEDACQALGAFHSERYTARYIERPAHYNGKEAGNIGDTGCFSFIAPKTLGGAGDAGGIITNNESIYQKLLLLRNHWNITQNALIGVQPPAPEIMDWGYNSRLDNIQAAILNIKIKYYPKMLERRREIGIMYNEGLKNITDIKLPLQQKDQIYQEYIIRVSDIWKLKDYMENERGVELLVRDTTPNHLLKGLNLEHFHLPVTEKMAAEIVRLPLYPELTNEEVNYVIACVKDFYSKK